MTTPYHFATIAGLAFLLANPAKYLKGVNYVICIPTLRICQD